MQATTSLEVGQVAPEFRLKGPGGQFVTLSEYRGQKNVVLVFYPLAFSSVCSHQLPTVDKFVTRFADTGAVVFGISVDSHYANTEFASKLKLTFPLLSDFKREASAAYGVLLPEAGYSQRAVFVVDRQGLIAHKDISANMSDLNQIPSNERILAALERLK
jgi:peroxiredoxin (alkyl hydroperoxide reductase subunit C)